MKIFTQVYIVESLEVRNRTHPEIHADEWDLKARKDAISFIKTLTDFPSIVGLITLLLVKPTMPRQKQPYKGGLRKRCSENMQQIYMTTPMPKYDFELIKKKT